MRILMLIDWTPGAGAAGAEAYALALRAGLRRAGDTVRLLTGSAGTAAQLLAKDESYAHVRLPSGEVRLVNIDCRATVGQVSNLDHVHVRLGKAGRKRWLGRRPSVRGVAMNPVDHPMGGGEGRSSGGRHPCTPWGMPTKGFKTRKNQSSDKFIVKRRGKKK